MGLVLALAAGLWGMGWLMGASLRARGVLLGLLWLGVVSASATLPIGNPLRDALGDPRGWLVLGGAVGLIHAYRLGLAALRARVAPAPEKSTPGTFSEAELNRYSRHIMLRELGGAGQKRLKAARVLVIGTGGLGSPALLYLAAAGVGTIGIIDDDLVEGSNLQRQIIHTDARIGTPKVFSAQTQMQALNPFVTVHPYHRRLTEDSARSLFRDHDLILDGSDSFDTREMVNRVAVETGVPLISAAITQWEGQIGLYDPARGGPCYACVFPTRPAPGLAPACAEAGVVAPLPGVIGSMMALEAVKYLTAAGDGLRGALVLHDALHAQTRRMRTAPRGDCAVCGGRGAGTP
jgi:molybdopterin/thiamine biosynthesis adenylyltransferase